MIRRFLVLFLILWLQSGLENIYGNVSGERMLVSKLTIEKVFAEKVDETSVRITVKTKIVLTNLAETRMFLLDDFGFPHFESGFILSESDETLRLGRRLAFAFDGESVDTSAKWKLLAKKIDTPEPNPDLFLFLDSGASREFKKTLTFFLPLSEKNRSNLDYDSWEKVRNYRFVSLQLLGSSWTDNIDRASKDLTETINRRWRQYGYLWTGSIITEPVLLDLESISFRSS